MQIRGSRRYLFAMLDVDTRYWIAWQVAEHKGTDDVRPMFRKARDVAGKVPSKLTSDGAANFAEAHRAEYAPKNFLRKDSEHESHIYMAGDRNNNQMESFNGNTVRLREGSTRGLKTDDSAILSGLHIYHNHVCPHLGLPEHSTPEAAASIAIRGGNGLKALIQAAAKAERVKSAD
ncbi:MAG: DDE-type integrase/transposase/recombinase [Thaumarchaeota archaeon]|nr:DDE-type integrase/transposase/recombinase [Nitrososphaerota archaeon]